MKFAASLSLFTFATIAGFTLQASAAPTSEWMEAGSIKPHQDTNTCPKKGFQITNQKSHDFYQEYCINSMCVGTKGLSHLSSTTFTGGCAETDVHCAAVYDSPKTDVKVTDKDYTVSYPQGHVLCSLPYKTTSVFTCTNGASVEVTVEDSSYTSATFKSTNAAPVSGYFKSWRDEKGCAITSEDAYSHHGQDIFYPACGVKSGESVCVP